MKIESFTPPFLLRKPMVQTILNSSKIRTIGNNPVLQHEQEILLNPFGEIKLQGFLTKQQGVSSKGTIIFLHGWEGNARSAYIINNANY